MPSDCCPCGRPKDLLPREDSCSMGCGYLNGGLQGAMAQFFLFSGALFSLATLADCSFVSVIPAINVSEDLNTTIDHFGLITFQRPSDLCYWYEDGSDPEDQIRDYFDFLGGKWSVARIFAAIAACCGIVLFFVSTWLCCSSFAKPIRWFASFLLCYLVAIFQALTFLTFSSSICEEYECQLSRSAGWSIAAAVSYSLSGVTFLFMRDYPGAEVIKRLQDEKNAAENEAKSKKPSVAVAKDNSEVSNKNVLDSISEDDDPEMQVDEGSVDVEDKAASHSEHNDSVSKEDEEELEGFTRSDEGEEENSTESKDSIGDTPLERQVSGVDHMSSVNH